MNILAADGNIVTFTANGALAVNLNAAVRNGYARILTLIITNGGKYAITWPKSVKWVGGLAPVLVAGGIDVITMITTNSGDAWLGVPSGRSFAL